MIVSMHDVWDTAVENHLNCVAGRIKTILKKTKLTRGYVSSNFLRLMLADELENIIVGKPLALKNIIQKVRAFEVSSSAEEFDIFMKESTKVFSYSWFSKKTKSGWNAYRLCELSKYSVCPYCNQNHINTITSPDEGDIVRPTLDHYYFKDQFPYLALSLYNLIPSCYICNSNLKGEKNFHEYQHLHPFLDEEDISFQLSWDNFEQMMSEVFQNNVSLDHSKMSVNCSGLPEAQNSIATFAIRERFEPHLNTAKQFVKLRIGLSHSKIEELREILGDSHSEKTFLQFDSTNYKNEILGKMKLDLFDQFDPNT